MTEALDDLQQTTAIQQRVISPARSAWVSANAGSGKTYVLTRRVMRLLIDQALGPAGRAAPERIVCITFTKAAAAEMEARLYKELSALSLASDETLKSNIAELDVPPLESHQLRKIRTLFAQALETPGGLKIQTIHSFCERILRRFPVEAGLLPGFEVAEEEARTVIVQLLHKMMANPPQDRATYEALAGCVRLEADPSKRASILAEMAKALQVWRAQHPAAQIEELIRIVRCRMGLPEAGTVADWQAAAMAKVDLSFLEQMHQSAPLLTGAKGLVKRTAACTEALEALPDNPVGAYVMLAEGWLTQAWTRFKASFGQKTAEKVFPGFTEQAEQLADVLLEAAEPSMIWPAFERTSVFVKLAWEIEGRYQQYKERRGCLDFDDLILKTTDLLQKVDSTWVNYKLDQGVDHILLDEAQDTAEVQWSVIEHFRDEIFALEEDNDRQRTSFVVGDRKQSIYSFQGADATLFAQKRRQMQDKVGRVRPYAEESLFLSFRSSPAVLDLVDAIFVGEAAQGVADEGEAHILHKARHQSKPGIVEVWPMIEKPEKIDENAWDLPLDSTTYQHPRRILADQICLRIKEWLDTSKRRRLSSGKAIRPGDVMILCQRRSEQFYEIIRGLARHNIPSGGADRIKLKQDIAVRDMLSLLRFATNHLDDLSLAEALKSPLWEFTDDELTALAWNRGGLSLWARMARRRQEADALGRKCASAMLDIRAAERAGQQYGPYAFFSTFLESGNPSGWYRIRQRLGTQSDEPLEELLNEALHVEYRDPRSLSVFLAQLEGNEKDVKKQPADAGDVVRVMTVHGAKGLEAPIVILADANDEPNRRNENTLTLDGAEGPLVITKPKTEECRSSNLAEAMELAKSQTYDEYRRVFYVAATRAEEELYICGVELGKRPKEAPDDPHDRAMLKPAVDRPWLGLAVEGMRRIDCVAAVPAAWGEDHSILRYQVGKAVDPVDQSKDEKGPIPPAPDWLTLPVPPEPKKVIEFPSQAVDGDTVDAGPTLTPHWDGAGVDPRRRGTLIHSLLQLLPSLDPTARADAGHQILARRAADLPEKTRQEWVQEVLSVLSDPDFAAVFTDKGLAEVAIQGEVDGHHYSGQLDRLLVTPTHIHIVEYKTHRQPPEAPDLIPADIVGQLRIYSRLLRALYPDRAVEAAVLWTHAPSLMPVPQELLMAP